MFKKQLKRKRFNRWNIGMVRDAMTRTITPDEDENGGFQWIENIEFTVNGKVASVKEFEFDFSLYEENVLPTIANPSTNVVNIDVPSWSSIDSTNYLLSNTFSRLDWYPSAYHKITTGNRSSILAEYRLYGRPTISPLKMQGLPQRLYYLGRYPVSFPYRTMVGDQNIPRTFTFSPAVSGVMEWAVSKQYMDSGLFGNPVFLNTQARCYTTERVDFPIGSIVTFSYYGEQGGAAETAYREDATLVGFAESGSSYIFRFATNTRKSTIVFPFSPLATNVVFRVDFFYSQYARVLMYGDKVFTTDFGSEKEKMSFARVRNPDRVVCPIRSDSRVGTNTYGNYFYVGCSPNMIIYESDPKNQYELATFDSMTTQTVGGKTVQLKTRTTSRDANLFPDANAKCFYSKTLSEMRRVEVETLDTRSISISGKTVPHTCPYIDGIIVAQTSTNYKITRLNSLIRGANTNTKIDSYSFTFTTSSGTPITFTVADAGTEDFATNFQSAAASVGITLRAKFVGERAARGILVANEPINSDGRNNDIDRLFEYDVTVYSVPSATTRGTWTIRIGSATGWYATLPPGTVIASPRVNPSLVSMQSTFSDTTTTVMRPTTEDLFYHYGLTDINANYCVAITAVYDGYEETDVIYQFYAQGKYEFETFKINISGSDTPSNYFYRFKSLFLEFSMTLNPSVLSKRLSYFKVYAGKVPISNSVKVIDNTHPTIVSGLQTSGDSPQTSSSNGVAIVEKNFDADIELVNALQWCGVIIVDKAFEDKFDRGVFAEPTVAAIRTNPSARGKYYFGATKGGAPFIIAGRELVVNQNVSSIQNIEDTGLYSLVGGNYPDRNLLVSETTEVNPVFNLFSSNAWTYPEEVIRGRNTEPLPSPFDLTITFRVYGSYFDTGVELFESRDAANTISLFKNVIVPNGATTQTIKISPLDNAPFWKATPIAFPTGVGNVLNPNGQYNNNVGRSAKTEESVKFEIYRLSYGGDTTFTGRRNVYRLLSEDKDRSVKSGLVVRNAIANGIPQPSFYSSDVIAGVGGFNFETNERGKIVSLQIAEYNEFQDRVRILLVQQNYSALLDSDFRVIKEFPSMGTPFLRGVTLTDFGIILLNPQGHFLLADNVFQSLSKERFGFYWNNVFGVDAQKANLDELVFDNGDIYPSEVVGVFYDPRRKEVIAYQNRGRETGRMYIYNFIQKAYRIEIVPFFFSGDFLITDDGELGVIHRRSINNYAVSRKTILHDFQ